MRPLRSPRPRTAGTPGGSRRPAGSVLALTCAVALAACAVEPTRVADAGPAPVISARGAAGTIYLLRGGRLAPKNVTTASPAVEDLITALFEVGRQPGDGLGTALRGFRLEQSVLGRYGVDSGVRNDPENPVGLRLHVIVNGPGRLGRTAMAQITCTARLREEIWAVKITQTTPKGPLALGEHTCKEYHRLAAPSVNLPP